MNKDSKKVYYNFVDAFPITTWSNIVNLDLSNKQGFMLKDLNEFDSNKLNALATLNISDNIISKLSLKQYLNLREIIATRNMIGEINFYLPKLMKIDLSSNLLSSLYDLSSTPNLQYLNVNNNLINNVNFHELRPVSKTLLEFHISFNKLQFETDDFISFVDGLKIMNINNLSIEGNLFILDNKHLTNTYRVYIISALSSLKKINGETITIDRRNLNPTEISNQMLAHNKYFEDVKTKDDNKINEEINNKFQGIQIEKDSINDELITLNEKIEELNSSGGNDNEKIKDLFREISSVLEIKLVEDENIQSKNELEIKYKQFDKFLMNSLMLIDLNPNIEQYILDYFGLFTMYNNGIFAYKCFNFFESLYKSSACHADTIKKVITDKIINQMKENKKLYFNILKHILEFKKETLIDINSLYSELIDKICAYLNEVIKNEILACVNRGLDVKKDEEIILQFNTCINFLNAYLDNEDLDEYSEEMDEKEKNDLIKLKIEKEKDKHNESSYSNIDNNLNINNINNEIKEKKENDLSISFNSDYDFVSISCNDNIYDEDNIEKNEALQKEENFKLVFDISLENCCLIFNNLDSLFKPDLIELIHNVLDLFINLFTKFSNTKWANLNEKDEYPKKDVLKKINEKIYHFLKPYLGVYISDYKIFDNKIKDDIIRDRNKIEDRQININIKQGFIKLFECLGSVVLVSRILDEIYNDVPRMIISILNQATNCPFILTGACKYFFKIISVRDLETNETTFSKLMNNVNYFYGLIRYLDNNESRFITLFEYVNANYDSSLKKQLKKKNNDSNHLESLKCYIILDLFSAIIQIFQKIALYSKQQSQITISAIKVMEELKKSRQLEILGNCLKIPNDRVKVDTVKCLFFFDFNMITQDVIDQIIKIISKYESVTEGENEKILSYIFIILNEIAIDLFRVSVLNKNFEICSKALEQSMTFLENNLDRDLIDKNEAEQKNTLSTSLVTFMNTSSRSPLYLKSIKPESIQNFKNILMFDLEKHKNHMPYLPIELERIQISNYLSITSEVMRGNNPMPPYTYVFLRILIKIADALLNIEDFSYSVEYTAEMNDLDKNLQNEIKMRIRHRIINEHLNWYDFSTDLKQWIIEEKDYKTVIKQCNEINQLEKNYELNPIIDDELKTKFEKFHTLPDKKDNDILLFFKDLYDKLALDKQKSDREFDRNKELYRDKKKRKPVAFSKIPLDLLLKEQINFLNYFTCVLMYVLGQSSNLNLKDLNIFSNLSTKFDPIIMNSKSILDTLKSYKDNKLFEIEDDILFSNSITSLLKHKYRDPEILRNNIKAFFFIFEKRKFNIYKQTEKYQKYYQTDIKTYNKYGFDNDNRIIEEETENNPHLRSLVICAFLRSIYSLLVSPSILIRQNFIELLFLDDKLYNIFLFARTALEDEYNVKSKLICIFNKIFKKNNLISILKINYEYKVKNQDPVLNEEKLFYNLYLFSIMFDELIHSIVETSLKNQKHDLLLIRDLLTSLYRYLECIISIKFNIIDDNFIQYSIIKKLINEDLIDLIFLAITNANLNIEKAKHKILNLSYKITDNLEDIKKTYDKTYNNEECIDYLLYFICMNNEFISNMNKLLSILRYYYPECNYYIDLKLFVDNDLDIKKKKVKTIIDTEIYYKNLLILQKEKFGIYSIILYYEFCQLVELNIGKPIIVLVVLTNKELYVYIRDKDDLHIKNIFSPHIQISIDKIPYIITYDYFNRILMKVHDKEFSLLFKNYYFLKDFLDILNYYNSKLQIIKYNSISAIVKNFESEDDYIKNIIKERDKIKKAKKDKESKKSLSDESHKILQRNKFEYDNIIKEYKTLDSLESNQYHTDTYLNCNIFVYVVEIDQSYSILGLFKGNDTTFENNSVLYISDYYLYMFKENFFNLKSLPSESNHNGNLIVDGSYVYDIKLKIKLNSIKILKFNKSLEVLIYHSEDNSVSCRHHKFKFLSEIEYICFISKIQRSILITYI